MKSRKDCERALGVVRAVITEWDPYALLRDGAPPNEFDAETAEVTARLATIRNADDAARVISTVFSAAFEAQPFSPKDCSEVGEKLYSRLAEARLLG